MATTSSRNITAQHQETKALSSWFARFKSKHQAKKEPEPELQSIFNVPLAKSMSYANVAISLCNSEGHSYIYGYIPIVVAKCGLFLKENATETEGIFRLSGSAKRIKDLQVMFDEPPMYGKGLAWDGFTVHDAANLLRRYLNHLPDPIIPYDYYDAFREPLKSGWEKDHVIHRMQELVGSLPALNRQLLLYILDLLAVFASKSHINRMTSENLSAIFQPGLLTHPRDDMAPEEYRLSQEVLVFLVDNQTHFLLDMCPPEDEAAPEQVAVTTATAGSTQGVSRRRTLHSPKESPRVDRTEAASTQTPSMNVVSQSGATLSRANTLPTRRRAPVADSTPRHVSTPAVTEPLGPVQTFNTALPAQNTIVEDPSVSSSSSRTSLHTAPIVPESSVLTVSSHRSADPVMPSNSESQGAASSAIRHNIDATDRQIRAKEIKPSSSPSKFGNFFRKKRNPRESVSSSTSEAPVRRDLDQ